MRVVATSLSLTSFLVMVFIMNTVSGFTNPNDKTTRNALQECVTQLSGMGGDAKLDALLIAWSTMETMDRVKFVQGIAEVEAGMLVSDIVPIFNVKCSQKLSLIMS